MWCWHYQQNIYWIETWWAEHIPNIYWNVDNHFTRVVLQLIVFSKCVASQNVSQYKTTLLPENEFINFEDFWWFLFNDKKKTETIRIMLALIACGKIQPTECFYCMNETIFHMPNNMKANGKSRWCERTSGRRNITTTTTKYMRDVKVIW